MQIGALIRERRHLLGLTQDELAKGVCSQAEISRIENEEVKWSQFEKLVLLERLGLNVQKLLQGRTEYAEELCRQINLLKRNKHYAQLYHFIKSELNTPLAKSNLYVLQLLVWHEGICLFQLYEDVDGAMEKLHQALHMTKAGGAFYSSTECDILNSIALVYYDSGQIEQSLAPIETAFRSVRLAPNFHDPCVVSKLYYTQARAFTKLKKYEESIAICKEALAHCRNNDSSYLYGELLYQLGVNLMYMKEYTEAKHYFIQSKNFMISQDDFRYIDKVNEQLANID